MSNSETPKPGLFVPAWGMQEQDRKVQANTEKRFRCTWGASYIEQRIEDYPMDVFAGYLGYSPTDIESITGLSVGESCWCSSVDITVTRLQDVALNHEVLPVERKLSNPTEPPRVSWRPVGLSQAGAAA